MRPSEREPCRSVSRPYRDGVSTPLRLFAGTGSTAATRGAWKRIRAEVLCEEPMCQICKRTPATEVHHRASSHEGGTRARANLLAICRGCHSVLTQEQQRARRQGAMGNARRRMWRGRAVYFIDCIAATGERFRQTIGPGEEGRRLARKVLAQREALGLYRLHRVWL